MASKLKAVSPKLIEPQKPKILIYGKAEAGKTFGATGFPNTYFIDSEGGATRKQYKERLIKSGGVYFGQEEGSLDFKTIVEQVEALATEKHPYKTLVIDSISKLFGIEIGKAMESLGDKDQFGASKKPAVALTRRLINWIDRIDMNVVLIAHEKALWSDQKQIGTTFDAWEKLEYELDLCFNIVKQGESRKAYVKKSRLEQFPGGSSFDWSYEEFSKLYGKEIMEKEAKPIKIATPEQIVQLNKLLEVVKLPEGEVDKWLTKAGVTSFQEMNEDKVVACIGALKAKLPKSEDDEKPAFIKNQEIK